MMRLLIGCVLVAGACIAAVMLLGQGIGDVPSAYAGDKRSDAAPPSGRRLAAAGPEGKREVAAADDDEAIIPRDLAGKSNAQPLTIQEARVMPVQSQDVPSERPGKLLFLATEIQPGEFVPLAKRIPYTFKILAIPVSTWAGIPENERIVDERSPGKFYRRVRPTDDLAPGTTALVRQKVVLRALDVGDHVKEGQMLGVVNPALSVDELTVRQQKVEAASSDVLVAYHSKVEAERRLKGINDAIRKFDRSVSKDDQGVAEVTVRKYEQEEKQKKALVLVAQSELSAALTTLNMHIMRAKIDGVVRAIYKQPGEAVKEFVEPVLQIQSPKKLRVEAQVEVQDALVLRRRMAKANGYRAEAQRLRLEALLRGERAEPAAAARLMALASDLTRIEVEAARQEPPLSAAQGHRDEVTCVGVSGDRVVSGSEDQTVRIWARVAGEDRLAEQTQLDHRAPVRCLAVTGPKSDKKLLATGTSTGRVRLFDLDDLKGGQKLLKSKHTGAVNAAAFNADGTLCVTAGEDASLCLWDARTGESLGRVPNAHAAAVTSATFTAKGQVVTAGRDKKLIVWNLAEGGDGGKTLQQDPAIRPLERRSGDVAMPGVDPTGEYVLFDEGRELRVLSLATRKIVGTLRNAAGTPNFAHFALFGPDGKSILAGGNGPGRLQLWRAPGEGVRPAEMRQYLWSGTATCAAFDPAGKFAVTGTSDNRVVLWQLPSRAEAEKPLTGQLSYVEEFLDTSLRRLGIRADVENPGWVIPGASATIVVPPLK